MQNVFKIIFANCKFMTKRERLEAIIAHYSDGKPSVFAKMIGVAPSTISSWLSRDTIDYDLLFAKCEKLSSDWLLTGEGSMLKEDMVPAKVSYNPSIGKPYFDVDFIGGFNEILNNQTTIPACNVLIPGFEKASLWCNVTGHSMEPKINHGDIIALHECTINDIQFGEIYAVVLDTIRTIKILRRGTSSDRLLFVPINKPNYEEQEFEVSRIVRIFEVLGAVARFF